MWTRDELESLDFTQLRKLAKYYKVSTYRIKKGEIIDKILELFPSLIVPQEEIPQRSVRIRRAYGEMK